MQSDACIITHAPASSSSFVNRNEQTARYRYRCLPNTATKFTPTTTTLLRRTFNGPLSGTTRVSRHQKGKTNLHFTEARDSEWQWQQLMGHMQVCTLVQTDNHASTPSLSFYRFDACTEGMLITITRIKLSSVTSSL